LQGLNGTETELLKEADRLVLQGRRGHQALDLQRISLAGLLA
jgi:hypothetical protein